LSHRPRLLEGFARQAACAAGSSWAFALALGAVLVWGATGPFFGFSDTWQLVINTSTTIVTFLMVFLIQRSQNKDTQALQLKVNELVAAVQGASNRLINVEDFSEEEVQKLHRHYRKLVELAQQDDGLTESHSIEEAEGRHRLKQAATHAESRPAVGADRNPSAEPSRPGRGQRPISHVATASYPEAAGRFHRNGDGSHASVSASPETSVVDEEDELARFLHALAALRDRIDRHRQRIAEHERYIAECKQVLAKAGFRTSKLAGEAGGRTDAERR
jgi:low affinity Fe/Cu permease